ncbi:hypothetical protein TRFO_21389 [Tritrichomonas foetus]|uniref:Uncharacterized protein n=1 Tax=Tritrichomonas foetus TaxID=1144522 RepID=A0A1J4KJZ8_9EUKA|nr:hypothetical protein TRFO_21389 [Tritrichomonas foetus]|eukprot:OHT09669.1 hypothetical protein TRFO_21389 [Tritrichomonas foetus]
MSFGHTPLPYTPHTISIPQTSRRITSQQGVVIPIDRFAWLSDGAVRNIEKGLPLVSESKLSRQFLDPDAIAIQLERQRANLMEGFVLKESQDEELQPDVDIEITADTDEEKQYRKLHSKILRKNTKKLRNPGTGIIKRPPADDIIDNIGKINIKSARRRKYVPSGVNPFPAPPHRPRVQRLPDERTTSALVKTQMKKVFKAGSKPFMNIDTDEDFDTAGLYPPEEKEPEPQVIEDEDDLPHESLLLNPSKYDIFWTKNRVPFTRDEIEMLEGWKQDVADRMARDDQRTSRILKAREKAIERTFQSRSAFDKEIEITDLAMEKAVNLGPCKSQRAKKSSWEISARVAREDPSSLPYRKAVWNKFVNQIAKFGYITCESQKKIVMEFRSQLLIGRYVSQDLFWEAISVLDKMEYVSLPTMIVAEFLRKDLNVPEEDFVAYMKENEFPSQFYFLALDEIEIEERRKQGKKYQIMTTRNKKSLPVSARKQPAQRPKTPSIKVHYKI